MEFIERQTYCTVWQHRLLFSQVILLIFPLQVITAQRILHGQKDAICGAHCEILAVQDGTVKLIDEWPPCRTVVLGEYTPAAQDLVSPTEAAVADRRSAGGWRIVASVYFDHDADEVHTRLRFYGPDGKLEGTDDVLMVLEQIEIGHLASGGDLFAVTSNEEHVYNAQTAIWFLPLRGEPKKVLTIQGTLNGFTVGYGGSATGVRINRQTYDGVHAKTKGTNSELYAWDAVSKSLSRPNP